jgi:hypothetical protein
MPRRAGKRCAVLCCAVAPQVNMSLRQLQLLYADMTEEVVSGRDFDDMLANGHLLDIEDANASGMHTQRSWSGARSAACVGFIALSVRNAREALHSP